MSTPNEHFKWAVLVVDCLKTLRARSGLVAVPFTDYEVIPDLDGSPDDIFVWFICATKMDSDRFREMCLFAATDALKAELTARGFPRDAVGTLQSDCVSTEEIDAGGGRFAYFR